MPILIPFGDDLPADHDEQGVVYAAFQEHLELGQKASYARAFAMRLKGLFVRAKRLRRDLGNSHEKFKTARLEPLDGLAERMLAFMWVLVLLAGEPEHPTSKIGGQATDFVVQADQDDAARFNEPRD